MALEREQLRAMAQRNKESFKEYSEMVRDSFPGGATYKRTRNDQGLPENPWIILL